MTMKQLLLITEPEVNPGLKTIDVSSFGKRDAARAVITDHDGQVFLLNVSVHKYHKLPGGGIDEGEDIPEALKRELLEEIGCEAEVITEVGSIIEHRDFEKLVQTSYCFLARQTGQQRASALEEGELAEGMFEVKAKNIDEAIALLEKDKPDNVEGKFIQKRDLTFLKAAKPLL
jgi:8-oxo-dGTP diphosphatase